MGGTLHSKYMMLFHAHRLLLFFCSPTQLCQDVLMRETLHCRLELGCTASATCGSGTLPPRLPLLCPSVTERGRLKSSMPTSRFSNCHGSQRQPFGAKWYATPLPFKESCKVQGNAFRRVMTRARRPKMQTCAAVCHNVRSSPVACFKKTQ
jgi:hypothetical protein